MRTTKKVLTRLAVATVFLPLLLVALGCPDSDPLDPGNGELVVALEGINPGGTRYEQVTVRVQQIQLRPVDPAADAALGPNPLAVFTFPISGDVAQGRVEFPTSTVFAPGQYRIVRLNLQGVTLFDDDPVNPPPTCVEGVVDPGADDLFGTADDTSTIVDPRFNLPIGSQFVLENFTGNNVVNIPPGGGSVTVQIDVPMLAAAYETSFTCSAAVNQVCPQQNNTRSLSCLSNFNSATFLTMVKPAISFN